MSNSTQSLMNFAEPLSNPDSPALPEITNEEYSGMLASGILPSSSEMQQIYEYIQDGVEVTTNPVSMSTDTPTYTHSFNTGDYRINPPIDEASSMPSPSHTQTMMMSEDDTQFLSPATIEPMGGGDFHDNATISAILAPSERIHIADDCGLTNDLNTNHFNNQADDCGASPRKRLNSNIDVDKLFENVPSTQPDFTFQKFGMGMDSSTENHEYQSQCQINPEMKPPSLSLSRSHSSSLTSPSETEHSLLISCPKVPVNVLNPSDHFMMDQQTPNHSPHHHQHFSSRPSSRGRRNLPFDNSNTPSLNQSFPDRSHGVWLKILSQPDAQHRARYMTEGSRGAVKDSLQQGHPTVQLIGWNQDCKLDVFIGNDSGKVKPHGFYQACRISGKNATPSKERIVEGTNVIQLQMCPVKNMTATIDCVGILKLRNTDVEKRIGIVKTKKRSTKCRLIFRVDLAQPDGTLLTLQTASDVITCTQPAGQPEVLRMSLDSATPSGGQSLFVIGKNFTRGFKVLFQETESDGETVTWCTEATLESDYIHSTHFVCTVPPYKNGEFIYDTANVRIMVEAGGGPSEPVPFTYSSLGSEFNKVMSHQSSASSTQPSPSMGSSPCNNSPRSLVAPEALELVQQIQMSSANSKMFRIPDGVDFISQDNSNSLPNSAQHSSHNSMSES